MVHSLLTARSRSKRMRPFYAIFGCGEAEGIGTFSIDWGKGVGYFHSQVSCISKVVRHTEACRAKGIMLSADWPGSSFTLVVERKIKAELMKAIEGFCPDKIQSERLGEKLKFDFLVFSIEF